MTWQTYPINRFDDIAPQWDALQASSANLPFLESAFLKPLISEFATGQEVIAADVQGGRWVCAGIFKRQRRGVWETFQPSQLPLGALIGPGGAQAQDPAWMQRIQGLAGALPGITLSVGLTQLDSRFHARPADSSDRRTSDYIDTAWVDVDSPFDAYWEKRGKNLKQNTRKQRNKLEAEGTTTSLECITRPEDVAQAIADYGVLEGAGWKGANGTAVTPDSAQGRFYREMLERFCAMGRGRIYRYRFNDKVVSMDLCISTGPIIVILKTAYDESYKVVSPSTLMRQDEFRALFDEGSFERIEFYGKVMEWHTRWTDNARSIYHATAYRWPFLLSLHRKLAERRQKGDAVAATSD